MEHAFVDIRSVFVRNQHSLSTTTTGGGIRWYLRVV